MVKEKYADVGEHNVAIDLDELMSPGMFHLLPWTDHPDGIEEEYYSIQADSLLNAMQMANEFFINKYQFHVGLELVLKFKHKK